MEAGTDHERVGGRPLVEPAQAEERPPQAGREGHAPGPAAFRGTGGAAARAGLGHEQRAWRVVIVLAPLDPPPLEPERLTTAQPRVEPEEHEGVLLEPLLARGLDEGLELLRIGDRPHVALGARLSPTTSGALAPTQRPAELAHRVGLHAPNSVA